MRNLLKSTEIRRLNFIEILTKESGWITTNQIAKNLNCSTRIIKEDIIFFKENNFGFNIERSYLGLRIHYQANNSIKTFYQANLNNSPAFKLLENMFFNDDLKLTDLQDQLFVSHSSLYRLIKKINTSLTKNFNIEINSKDLKILGNEKDIQFYYSVYFYEIFCNSNWPFEEIDEEVLSKFLNFILNYLDLQVDFATFTNLKVLTAVNLTRYRFNHFIDIKLEDTYLNDSLVNSFPMDQESYQVLKALNIHLTESSIIQIFSHFVDKSFALDSEYFNMKIQSSEDYYASVSFLSDLLDKLSDKYNIPIINKEQITQTVSNAANNEGFLPHTAYILFNPNIALMDEFRKYNPYFMEDLTKGIIQYRQLIDKQVTPYSINHLVYQVCVNWPSLFFELQSKWEKVEAIFISDLSTGRTRLIHEILENKFGHLMVLELYNESELSNEQVMKLNKELIITTTPLPDLTDLAVFCFNGDVSKNELHQFRKTLNRILEEKNTT